MTRTIKRMMSFGALLLASGSMSIFGQSLRLERGSGNTEAFAFYYDTHVEPGAPALTGVHGGIMVDKDGFHRFMLDSSRKVYIGYDAIVEPVAPEGSYRVTFRPLTLSPGGLTAITGSSDSTWTPLPTPGWVTRSSQVIAKGQVLELTLMTNSATGQRIVDYVTVQEPPAPPVGFNTINTPVRGFEYVGGTPRDFRVDDAELHLESPRLTVNGKADASGVRAFVEVTGRVVWVYIPNRGRFLLSLTPQAASGFLKAGEVRGSTLTFKLGNDTFNIAAGAPIAARHAPFNLYVRHEPAWKPDYPFADVTRTNFGVFEGEKRPQ